MALKVVVKTNHDIEITGTFEVVYGTCAIEADADDPRGWSFTCAGTDIDWDSQKQVTKHVDSRGYLPVFLGSDDQQYTADQIEVIDVEDEDDEDEEEGDELTERYLDEASHFRFADQGEP